MEKRLATSLDQFLNESKKITVKRKYGERPDITVGANAPVRNKILNFVAENRRVSKMELKRFIAGLNETSKNPNVAATMWMKRNAKFFIAESKSGKTFFRLSPIGKRLAGRILPISEAEERFNPNLINGNKFNRREEDIAKRNDMIARQMSKRRFAAEEMEEMEEMEESGEGPIDIWYKNYKEGGLSRMKRTPKRVVEDADYDFVDTKKGYPRKGVYSMKEDGVSITAPFREPGVSTIPLLSDPEILACLDNTMAKKELEDLRMKYQDFDSELGEIEGKDKYKSIILDLIDTYCEEGAPVRESNFNRNRMNTLFIGDSREAKRKYPEYTIIDLAKTPADDNFDSPNLLFLNVDRAHRQVLNSILKLADERDDIIIQTMDTEFLPSALKNRFRITESNFNRNRMNTLFIGDSREAKRKYPEYTIIDLAKTPADDNFDSPNLLFLNVDRAHRQVLNSILKLADERDDIIIQTMDTEFLPSALKNRFRITESISVFEEDKEEEFSLEDIEADLEKEDEKKSKKEAEEETEEETGETEEETEEEDEKVEITEFIIQVDNVEEAIKELEELGVSAEKVEEAEDTEESEEEEVEESEEGEEGGKIRVSAEDWDTLKGWLEEKGVDIEEMFGGEIDVEDDEAEEESEDEEAEEEAEEEEETEEAEEEVEEGSESSCETYEEMEEELEEMDEMEEELEESEEEVEEMEESSEEDIFIDAIIKRVGEKMKKE